MEGGGGGVCGVCVCVVLYLCVCVRVYMCVCCVMCGESFLLFKILSFLTSVSEILVLFICLKHFLLNLFLDILDCF